MEPFVWGVFKIYILRWNQWATRATDRKSDSIERWTDMFLFTSKHKMITSIHTKASNFTFTVYYSIFLFEVLLFENSEVLIEWGSNES